MTAKTGMAYAAGIIRAEAQTEQDLDLAALCEYAAEAHRPGPDMRCAACGEPWLTAKAMPNVGGLRCQAYLDIQAMKNEWIIRRVQAIAERWCA